MSSFGKTGWALAAALLLCIAALPASSHAQSRSAPYSFELNSNNSGSYLGIQMDDVTAANTAKYKLSSERGVIVHSVESGSPASAANLKADDVILDYAGEKVWSASQFSRLVQETPPGRKVDLGVSRDGKRITLTAEIGTRGTRQSENRLYGPSDNLEQMFRNFRGLRVMPGDGDFEADQPAGKPRLGVSLQSLTDQQAESLAVPGKEGAMVASVLEGSPSAGKLKAFDVIVQADGSPIREPEDLTQLLGKKSQGNMTLKVIRDKKEITVVVNLPAAPEIEKGGSRGGIKL